MKNLRSLCLLFGILVLFACKKDKNTIIETLENGKTWKVAYFEEDGTDATNLFLDYIFTFKGSGIVQAVRINYIADGTYAMGGDKANENNLNISFGAIMNFEGLSNNWEILEETPTKVRFQSAPVNNSAVDYLTFEKI